ncbi:hypothetical protein IPJ72_01890 [Candidatus Peregrinibacteria bacterium]|nr:MAG: hypothetical protein IPJ72_01890 [Candidatus Peregrinibacteria bacterium]
MHFFSKKTILALLVVLNIALFFGFTPSVHAQGSLGNDWSQFLSGFLPNFQAPADATGQEVALSVVRRAVQMLKYIIGAVAVVFGLIYAMGFIFLAEKRRRSASRSRIFCGCW